MRLSNLFTKKFHVLPLIISSAFLFFSCSQLSQIQKEEPPPQEVVPAKPTISGLALKIGSLNLSNLSKKIEFKDVEYLKNVIEQDSIDILAIQGITRYPELNTRTDLIDELQKLTNFRKAFGENINLSGRQTGNVIFSEYPILFYDNTYYEGIKSTKFEAVLHAQIDCGVETVVIFNTLLPEKASIEEQTFCIKTISILRKMYQNYPVIVLGNLPSSNILRELGNFEGATVTKGKNGSDNIYRVWFNGKGLLNQQNGKIVDTRLGQLMVIEFQLVGESVP